MKKIIKALVGLSLLILLTIVVLNNASIIKADSGWDTDYDSGGSWDSGSDWGGSSWDSGSDFNDHSSVDSMSPIDISQDEFFTFLFLIIITVFIAIISINVKHKRLASKDTNEIDISKYKELTQEQVNKIMPSLNVLEFNFKAYQIFYDVQMAWMNFDYDKLKELLTDELYNSYVMQLDVLKSKNHKNVMKGFELIESHIYDLKEENELYIVKVFLDVSFLDYIENVNTGIIVRGSVNNKVCNTYVLTFTCSKEKATDINKCPNCGAKVEGNATGTCEHCKSKLINKTYNWVMSKKEKINQK